MLQIQKYRALRLDGLGEITGFYIKTPLTAEFTTQESCFATDCLETHCIVTYPGGVVHQVEPNTIAYANGSEQPMDYNAIGLNILSKQLREFQIKVGFADSDITQDLMLIHSEVSEAFEAYQKDKIADIESFETLQFINQQNHTIGIDEFDKVSFENKVKDTLEDELIDILVRTMALCGKLNIDIASQLKYKMQYNELRGYKYGGKKF